ncbi:MAG: hypothetical protein PVI67_01845 [Anaerolineae bacterium]|jgi:hypothetical protein
MPACHVIDAYPAFQELWSSIRHKTTDEQIAAWEAVTRERWPELLAMQIACYEEDGEDWRQIAREMVFPRLGGRVPGMEEAHRHLLRLCQPAYVRFRQRFGLDTDLIFVIHVGIGCGAGWTTTYQGAPAVLFDLENAAEEGWAGPEVLTGLIAHELGHVAHHHWRRQQSLPIGSGPWWQLYAEGFAQRCEHVVAGEGSWHMARTVKGWLSWCQANEPWLAAEFLRTVEHGESVRPFFGSWFELRGWKQTGYYLGHAVIRRMETGMGLHEIALLDDIESRMRSALEAIAAADG